MSSRLLLRAEVPSEVETEHHPFSSTFLTKNELLMVFELCGGMVIVTVFASNRALLPPPDNVTVVVIGMPDGLLTVAVT